MYSKGAVSNLCYHPVGYRNTEPGFTDRFSAASCATVSSRVMYELGGLCAKSSHTPGARCQASGVLSIGRAPCSGTMWLIESQCVEVWPHTVNATTSYEYGAFVSPSCWTSSCVRCCHITVR